MESIQVQFIRTIQFHFNFAYICSRWLIVLYKYNNNKNEYGNVWDSCHLALICHRFLDAGKLFAFIYVRIIMLNLVTKGTCVRFQWLRLIFRVTRAIFQWSQRTNIILMCNFLIISCFRFIHLARMCNATNTCYT